MDEDRSIQALIIRYLVAHTQCSGCGNRYDPSDVQIHERRGDVWLATVTCSVCGLQGLIMAAIRSKDEHELGAVFEADFEEWANFQQMAPISSDELLDFHHFLEGFDGDVQALFQRDFRAT